MRIFVLLCLMVLRSEGHAQERAGDLGWLRGEVRNGETGEPLPFVKMQALFGASLWEGMTDHDGSYVIRVPWGPFVMTADAEGYYVQRVMGKVDRRTMTFVDLELQPMKKVP